MVTDQQIKIKLIPLFLAIAMLLVGCSSLLLLGHAKAAPFTQAFVRFDRLKAVTATGGRVCAQAATAAIEASVQVTFPTTGGTDYVVNATAINWTVTPPGSTPARPPGPASLRLPRLPVKQ